MPQPSLSVVDFSSRRFQVALQPGFFAALIDLYESQRTREPSADEGSFGKMVYPHFVARALVPTADSPRSPAFEPWIERGPQVAFLDGVLKGHVPFPHPQRVVLVLPERWLAPLEQQRLMQALHAYAGGDGPSTGVLTRVDVVTMSPVILTDFNSSAVTILTSPMPI